MTHGLAFPLYAFSTVHALTAGTDTTESWLQAVMILTSVLVAVLTLVRITGLSGGQKRSAANAVTSSSWAPTSGPAIGR